MLNQIPQKQIPQLTDIKSLKAIEQRVYAKILTFDIQLTATFYSKTERDLLKLNRSALEETQDELNSLINVLEG